MIFAPCIHYTTRRLLPGTTLPPRCSIYSKPTTTWMEPLCAIGLMQPNCNKHKQARHLHHVFTTEQDLDGAIVCNQLMLHVFIPKSELRQVLQQMLVHDLWHHNSGNNQILRYFTTEWSSSCLTSLSTRNRLFPIRSFQAINCTGMDNIK